jgi:hypothetical protein
MKAVPELAPAVGSGVASPAHLDAIANVLAGLDADQRALLAGESAWIAEVAARTAPEDLARVIRRRLRQLSADDEIATFKRQQRAQYLRWWIDEESGMVRFDGALAPDVGARFMKRVRGAVEQLFHDKVPDTCPEDPDRKQHHLRALALVDLVCRDSANTPARPSQPEILVIIDIKTLVEGWHDGSRVEVEGGVHIPLDTIRRYACFTNLTEVRMSNGVVLDLGRTRRMASPEQRKALRAMYATCAIPGCRTAVHDCEAHHIDWWEHGGPTNLANLVPLCSRHHHAVHEGRWHLTIDHNRRLTIHYPDGTTSTTGPPYERAG